MTDYKYKVVRKGKIVQKGIVSSDGKLGDKGFLWGLIAKVFEKERKEDKK